MSRDKGRGWRKTDPNETGPDPKPEPAKTPEGSGPAKAEEATPRPEPEPKPTLKPAKKEVDPKPAESASGWWWLKVAIIVVISAVTVVALMASVPASVRSMSFDNFWLMGASRVKATANDAERLRVEFSAARAGFLVEVTDPGPEKTFALWLSYTSDGQDIKIRARWPDGSIKELDQDELVRLRARLVGPTDKLHYMAINAYLADMARAEAK